MDPLAPKIHADFYGLTDVGRVRKQNEDNLLMADLQTSRRTSPKRREQWRLGGRGFLFAVCDGMGGAAAGEVASQMAVDTLFEELKDLEPAQAPQVFAELLDRTIQKANHVIHTTAQQDQTKKGMGTTVSAAAIYGNVAFLAQVGDSRAYLLRNGVLTRVTKDQSLLERLIEEGAISPEHAKNFVGKNVILQALGPVAQILVDLKFIDLAENDLVMLCSDGLHGPVTDEAIEEILKTAPSVQDAAHALINRANKNGGPDNVTAIVIRFSGTDLARSEGLAAAIPQPVKYARAPIDTITLRMEKELGLAHWINKYVFATPLLITYGVLLLVGVIYILVHLRSSFKEYASRPPIVAPVNQSAQLIITSDVRDAELLLDDTVIGKLREGLFQVTLAHGQYTVVLRKGTWKSERQKVVLNGTKDLHISQQSGAATGSERDELLRRARTMAGQDDEWLPGHDSEKD